MIDLIVGWLLAPTVALGAFVVVAGWLVRSWRPAIPTVSPLLLGVVCALSAWAISASLGRFVSWAPPDGWGVVGVAAVCGMGGAFVAFHIEKRLSRALFRGRERRRREASGAALPASLRFVDLPSSTESFQGVGRIARHRVRFALLTAWTVTCEELLYRGAVLLVAVSLGLNPILGLVLQAAFYALSHIAFGPPAVAGKLMLGLMLGAVTLWSGSLIPALCAHSFYQVLVWRQFAAPARVQVSRQA